MRCIILYSLLLHIFKFSIFIITITLLGISQSWLLHQFFPKTKFSVWFFLQCHKIPFYHLSENTFFPLLVSLSKFVNFALNFMYLSSIPTHFALRSLSFFILYTNQDGLRTFLSARNPFPHHAVSIVKLFKPILALKFSQFYEFSLYFSLWL